MAAGRVESAPAPLMQEATERRHGGCPRDTSSRGVEVWSYDFIHDKCSHGHRLKFLTITDEFTRQSLAVVTATSIRAKDAMEVLDRLFVKHGAPQYLRSD